MLEKFLRWNDVQNKAFTERYQVLSVDIESAEQKKIFLGEGESRICRYCGDDSTRTTFKEQSHAIPLAPSPATDYEAVGFQKLPPPLDDLGWLHLRSAKPWHQLGVTKLVALQLGVFGSDPIVAEGTGLLCRHTPFWD